MAAYILDGQTELWGAIRAVGFGDDAFSVREIHRDRANAVIKRNHYSKSIVNNSYVHLGVFIDGEMYGVLQFGYAMNPASGGTIVPGTQNDEYLELNRMWLDDFAPKNSESRAIGHAIKYIRRALPKVRWIQSFADERCGSNGVVYQAANFGFYGSHTSTFWELDGVWYHNIVATSPSKGGAAKRAALMPYIERATKHTLRQFRYIYFMQRRFARAMTLPQMPFPKIANRPEDEAATSGIEAGATPAVRSTSEAAA